MSPRVRGDNTRLSPRTTLIGAATCVYLIVGLFWTWEATCGQWYWLAASAIAIAIGCVTSVMAQVGAATLKRPPAADRRLLVFWVTTVLWLPVPVLSDSWPGSSNNQRATPAWSLPFLSLLAPGPKSFGYPSSAKV